MIYYLLTAHLSRRRIRASISAIAAPHRSPRRCRSPSQRPPSPAVSARYLRNGELHANQYGAPQGDGRGRVCESSSAPRRRRRKLRPPLEEVEKSMPSARSRRPRPRGAHAPLGLLPHCTQSRNRRLAPFQLRCGHDDCCHPVRGSAVARSATDGAGCSAWSKSGEVAAVATRGLTRAHTQRWHIQHEHTPWPPALLPTYSHLHLRHGSERAATRGHR